MRLEIAVVGSWHLATVLAAHLGTMGHLVIGLVTAEAEPQLSQGIPPVEEPRLREALANALRSGRLRYSADPAKALSNVDIVIVAIDTPVDDEDRADLTAIEQTFAVIARFAREDTLVVVSSQVPVGACRSLYEQLLTERSDLGGIVYNPEFLQLGRALECVENPDVVVLGGDDARALERARTMFADPESVVVTGLETAEMVKHASNTFLATSVSFINEIADLCELTGADATHVAAALRLDRRIGKSAYIAPGLGFAGGTLGRDLRALQDVARRVGVPTRLIDAVQQVNQDRQEILLRRIEGLETAEPGAACLLGLTYKPGTTTLRRSMGVQLAHNLLDRGWLVRAHDPAANAGWEKSLPARLELCTDPYEAARAAKVIVLVTDWPIYKELDLERLYGVAPEAMLLDGRNALDPAAAKRAGLSYWGVGRRLLGRSR